MNPDEIYEQEVAVLTEAPYTAQFSTPFLGEPSMLSTNRPSPNVLVNKNCSVTELKATNFSFTWTIKNFSLCTERVSEKMQSPTFYAGRNDEYTWRLHMFPAGEKEESKDYIAVYLMLVSCKEAEVWVKHNFFVTGLNGNKTKITANEKPNKIRKGSGLGYTRFTSFGHLRTFYLVNDSLTMICEGSIRGDRVDTRVRHEYPPVVVECTLSKDFASLFEDRIFSDVTLTVGNKNLPAHKAILATRSPVFAAMFAHEMEESKQNRVVIEDVEYEVLVEVLRYIYTGKCLNIDKVKVAEKLLPAADKYNLEGLKKMCEEYFCSTLAVANVAGYLMFADIHNAEVLKAEAIHFMNTHLADVIQTTSWKDMAARCPYLLTEAFETQAMEQELQ